MKILGWSLPICRVAGIRIQVHATFALLLFMFWIDGYGEANLTGALWAMAFLVAIFSCVVLHELGHSLVAQRFGISVRDITLLPIGGVASLRSLPEDPKQELAITVAGPIVNVAIFTALYVARALAPMVIPFRWFEIGLERLPVNLAQFWGGMLYINKMMVAFNLIPALPMDGGRILRAALVRWLGYVRATVVAARVGQGFAMLFLTFGALLLWMQQPAFIWPVIIGALVLFAADAERRLVVLRGALRGATVADAMSHHFVAVSAGDRLRDCAEKVVRAGQEDFPVMEEGELIGLLERDALQDALTKGGPDTRVGEVMARAFPAVSPEASLADVQMEMMTGDWSSFPVRKNGELVGWLSRENVARFVALRKVFGVSKSR